MTLHNIKLKIRELFIFTGEKGWYSMCRCQPTVGLVVYYLQKNCFQYTNSQILQLVNNCQSGILTIQLYRDFPGWIKYFFVVFFFYLKTVFSFRSISRNESGWLLNLRFGSYSGFCRCCQLKSWISAKCIFLFFFFLLLFTTS